MDNNFMKMKAAVMVAAFALPPITFADDSCLTAVEASDSSGAARATLVQGDQGQGSIECTVFQGYESVMHEVTADIVLKGGVGDLGTIGTTEAPLEWTVSDLAPADTHVDVLFISNAGDGSRCTQFYVGNARSGYVGAGLKINKESTVVACADDHADPVPPPPQTPPIATDQTEGCTGIYEPFQNAINNSNEFHGMVLFGPGVKEGNSGICTNKNIGDGKLKRCVNRCIVPQPIEGSDQYQIPYDPSLAECSEDGPFYPIECRACELSEVVEADAHDPNVEFCWEQIQKAETSNTHFTNGSFKKAPGSKGEQVWGIDRKHGSDCYLISGRTASGWPYSYWFPSDCPK